MSHYRRHKSPSPSQPDASGSPDQQDQAQPKQGQQQQEQQGQGRQSQQGQDSPGLQPGQDKRSQADARQRGVQRDRGQH